MEINYKAEDFTPHGVIDKDVINYIVCNVNEFGPRYHLALSEIEKTRCSLHHADHTLYEDIADVTEQYLEGYGADIEDICDDLEEVFG